MRFGYGMGGDTVADHSPRLRWIAVLLAFVIAAAMLFGSAARAEADGFSFSDLTATPDGCSVDVTVTAGSLFTEFPLFVYKVGVFEHLTLVGSDTNPEFLHAGETALYTISGLTPGTYKAVAIPPIYLFDTFTISPDDCHPSFEGDGFTGQLFCTDDCDFTVHNTGDDPDVTIDTDAKFSLIIKLDEKGIPGKSFVEVLSADGTQVEDILDKCGKGTKAAKTQCVHISNSGGQLTYTVFYDDDPRFKFR